MKKIVTICIAVVGILVTIFGLIFSRKESASIAVIGGADGPTTILVAGSLGETLLMPLVIIGLICIVVAIVICFKKKH